MIASGTRAAGLVATTIGEAAISCDMDAAC